ALTWSIIALNLDADVLSTFKAVVTPLTASAITKSNHNRLTMTDEKRKHGRLTLVMEASWEGSGSKSLARMVDISATGCFIETLAPVEVGETLNLRLTLHDGEYISLQAVVMYRMPSLGFGIRFTRISDSDRLRLDALLDAEAKDTRRTG